MGASCSRISGARAAHRSAAPNAEARSRSVWRAASRIASSPRAIETWAPAPRSSVGCLVA
eukprot:scaffold171044_cov30-Tisochrysis_lutea.AAC.5